MIGIQKEVHGALTRILADFIKTELTITFNTGITFGYLAKHDRYN